MKIKDKIWYGVLFIALAIPWDTYTQYYLIAILFLLGINNLNIRTTNDRYPILMLFVYFIGLVLGILYKYPMHDIISNHAGVVCYLVYYSLPKHSYDYKNMVARIVVLSSIVMCIFVPLAHMFYKLHFDTFWPISNIKYTKSTDSLLAPFMYLVFVLEIISLNGMIFKKGIVKKVVYISCFLISLYVVIFANNMSAFKLGGVIFIFLYVYLLLLVNNNKRMLFILLLFLAIYIIVDFNFDLFINNVFSSEDMGNFKRLYQFGLVKRRFKFWGNGHGSPLVYRVSFRDYNLYGVEVSFLNIIDKYGAFSLIMFYVYYKSIFGLIKKMTQNLDFESGILSICLMGYLIIGLGNPVIFSSYAVLLHCLSLSIWTEKVK